MVSRIGSALQQQKLGFGKIDTASCDAALKNMINKVKVTPGVKEPLDVLEKQIRINIAGDTKNAVVTFQKEVVQKDGSLVSPDNIVFSPKVHMDNIGNNLVKAHELIGRVIAESINLVGRIASEK